MGFSIRLKILINKGTSGLLVLGSQKLRRRGPVGHFSLLLKNRKRVGNKVYSVVRILATLLHQFLKNLRVGKI